MGWIQLICKHNRHEPIYLQENPKIMLTRIKLGFQCTSFINVLSECPFLWHRFWLYLQDRCTQMDWRRSCRPGSSNQRHTQQWGTRCHSHCSKIPGYRSNSQPHSELQSYSGRFPGDSLSLPSFLPYRKFLGDRCHLRRSNFSCIEVDNKSKEADSDGNLSH